MPSTWRAAAGARTTDRSPAADSYYARQRAQDLASEARRRTAQAKAGDLVKRFAAHLQAKYPDKVVVLNRGTANTYVNLGGQVRWRFQPRTVRKQHRHGRNWVDEWQSFSHADIRALLDKADKEAAAT